MFLKNLKAPLIFSLSFFSFFFFFLLPEITINILSYPFFSLDESSGDFLLALSVLSPQSAVSGCLRFFPPFRQQPIRIPSRTLAAARDRHFCIIIFLSPKTFCPNNITGLTLPRYRLPHAQCAPVFSLLKSPSAHRF